MSFHSVLIQKLLATNAHIGRHVTTHHFKIFSEGTRNSVGVIDSDKTLICLRSACNFIGQLARADARFLFVNTNPIFDEIINQMTRTIGIKNDTTWRLGGFLTNSSSPKKFRGRNKKLNLSAVQPPDCIVILDAERRSSVIQEANRLQIPIVGLVDSSMPWETFRKITYPVPANDSVEFVYLFCNLITKTILKEQEEGRADKEKEAVVLGEDVKLDNKTVKKDNIFLFPYESLEAVPEDISETKQLLDKLVILKFNGDMGTKVGFNGPKCTVDMGGGLTCLDLIVNQIEALNAKYGCSIPLISVNPVDTHDDILKVLKKHPNKNIHSVIQSQTHQKIRESEPHSAEGRVTQDEMDSRDIGEFFLPLIKSGKLDGLLSQGKEYILMLNSDNLAHVVDPKILNHLIQNNIKCCLEVMHTPSELEESSLPLNKEDTRILAPTKNCKFTNTMWVQLNSMESLVPKRKGKERFTISQLFDQFTLSVPTSRYLPFEATSDLFLLQSDLYNVTDGVMTRNAARENPANPSIELGPEFAEVNDFRLRFKSIPSILELDSLEVTGDVWFGTGITLKGKVRILAKPESKIVVPDGTVLEDTVITCQEDIKGGSL